ARRAISGDRSALRRPHSASGGDSPFVSSQSAWNNMLSDEIVRVLEGGRSFDDLFQMVSKKASQDGLPVREYISEILPKELRSLGVELGENEFIIRSLRRATIHRSNSVSRLRIRKAVSSVSSVDDMQQRAKFLLQRASGDVQVPASSEGSELFTKLKQIEEQYKPTKDGRRKSFQMKAAEASEMLKSVSTESIMTPKKSSGATKSVRNLAELRSRFNKVKHGGK
ncbi:hypothetical protein ADUPG1_003386, partial [Aduncisulcus paluster]